MGQSVRTETTPRGRKPPGGVGLGLRIRTDLPANWPITVSDLDRSRPATATPRTASFRRFVSAPALYANGGQQHDERRDADPPGRARRSRAVHCGPKSNGRASSLTLAKPGRGESVGTRRLARPPVLAPESTKLRQPRLGPPFPFATPEVRRN